MSRLSRQQIERKASKLLGESGQRQAPVDVEQVAKHLRIRIEYANLDDDCSGVLIKRDGGTAVIGINWEHHRNRQRFTLAHELGHYVLEHEGGTFIDKGAYAQFRDEDSHSGKISEERQANQFAAALLMPAHLVEKRFEDRVLDPSDQAALEELASDFQVSPQAMMIRLQRLKLLTAKNSPF